VVRGEAGIGKPAVLGYAVQRAAPGMLMLRADGVEAESDLAFAGLQGCCARSQRIRASCLSPSRRRSRVRWGCAVNSIRPADLGGGAGSAAEDRRCWRGR
jgi:hypothetical protein